MQKSNCIVGFWNAYSYSLKQLDIKSILSNMRHKHKLRHILKWLHQFIKELMSFMTAQRECLIHLSSLVVSQKGRLHSTDGCWGQELWELRFCRCTSMFLHRNSSVRCKWHLCAAKSCMKWTEKWWAEMVRRCGSPPSGLRSCGLSLWTTPEVQFAHLFGERLSLFLWLVKLASSLKSSHIVYL